MAPPASPRPPLPERLLGLLRESRWLLLVAVALYLILILFGFNRADPSWSHSASGAITHNPGGVLGAWLADVLLYLFGFSAWWWVTLMLQRVWAGYRRITCRQYVRPARTVGFFAGFYRVAVFQQRTGSLAPLYMESRVAAGSRRHVGSSSGQCVVAYTGLYRRHPVPAGVDGGEFQPVHRFVLAAFCRLAGRLRWKTVYLWARNTWQTRQDKRIGAQAMQERSVVVEEEKKRVEEHQPIHIEMPVYEVPRSTRVEKEKQVSLFADMPDSDLPPLHLLDEAKQQVEVVSAETLEFTSRLIERKLKDFGVEVKVVGAYPGPVITRYEIDPAVGVKGSQITNLVRDLARALSVVSIRVVETIPGKSYMALELPNPKRQIVHFLRYWVRRCMPT